MEPPHAIIPGILADFRARWPQLLIAHLVCSILGFALVTPLVTFVVRLAVSLSGDAALTDQDILFALLGPAGLVAFIAIGALIVTAVIFSYAVLMTVGYGARRKPPITWYQALRLVARRAGGVLHLAARMIAWTLLYAAPFFIAAGLVYWGLLTEHDINFYLAEKPRAYWIAAACIGLLLLVMAIVLIRLFVGWIYALPLVLWKGLPAQEALAASKRAADGRRLVLTAWLVASIVLAVVLSAVGAFVVRVFGDLTVPGAVGSLPVLVLVLGGVLLFGLIVGQLVAFVNTSLFSLLLVHLYRASPLADAQDELAVDAAATSGVPALTRRRLVWGSLVALTAALAVSYVLLTGLALEDETQVIAHRGAAGSAPENTLASVRAAVEQGADWVEIDVQETADGEVVVIHDSDLKKVAGSDLKIWDATTDTLQSIDIGSSYAPDFAAERVPTLREVLAACKGRAGVIIELKYYGHDERLEERVVEIVEAMDMASSVMVMSLSYPGVQKIRALRPGWKTGLLTSVTLGDVAELDVDFLAVNAVKASRAFIRRMQRSGKEVFVWTVNDPVGLSTMMSRGADGVITDHPGMAASVLEHRAELSTPERLLLELATLFGRQPAYGDV